MFKKNSFLMMLPFFFSIVSCVIWGPSQPPLVQIENAHEFGSKRVAFSPSGKYLATSGLALGEFSKIKIWSVPELRLLQIFSKHRNTVRGITWIDDNTVASGDEDGRIIVWNTNPPELLKVFCERYLIIWGSRILNGDTLKISSCLRSLRRVLEI